MNNEKSTGAQPGGQWGAGDQPSAPFATTVVNGRMMELFHGQHPHTRQDNTTYARAVGRDGGARVVSFNGHQRRVGVRIEEFNYLKESELSGDDVRKGCSLIFSFDSVDVYRYSYCRTVEQALAYAPTKLVELEELPVNLAEPEQILGRKVYYRSTPATITNVHDDGRVTIRTVLGVFPARPWDDADDEQFNTVAEDVLSREIWWFRE